MNRLMLDYRDARLRDYNSDTSRIGWAVLLVCLIVVVGFWP